MAFTHQPFSQEVLYGASIYKTCCGMDLWLKFTAFVSIPFSAPFPLLAITVCYGVTRVHLRPMRFSADSCIVVPRDYDDRHQTAGLGTAIKYLLCKSLWLKFMAFHPDTLSAPYPLLPGHFRATSGGRRLCSLRDSVPACLRAFRSDRTVASRPAGSLQYPQQSASPRPVHAPGIG